MSIERLLTEEIETELDLLKNTIEVGSDEYKQTVDGVTKLIDRVIDFKKLENEKQIKEADREQEAVLKREQFDRDDLNKGADREQDATLKREQLDYDNRNKEADREQDTNLKLKQIDEDRKDRIIRNGISVAGVVLPIGLTIWGALKSWEFEKTGTVTTMMGRGFIGKLISKK